MKNTLVASVTFVAGIALALFVMLPLMLADAFEAADTIRIVHRVSYSPDGKIRNAQFAYPTWSEYFAAASEESGYSVQTSGLPTSGGVSVSVANMTWSSAIIQFAPEGFEVRPISPGVYRVQARPNQALQPTATAVMRPADAGRPPAIAVADL
jgi:hypothetical protein